ncbi:MAG: MarR family transcriptional regulator [Armatimonadota bacterium]|nr:MarR family transcriptional regulator [Armatimonadota bacterium]
MDPTPSRTVRGRSQTDAWHRYTEHLADLFTGVVTGPFTRDVLRQVSGGSLTPALLSVLECLRRGGARGVGEVAQELSVSFPAATQLLHRLEARGLVVREADEQDRRRCRLRLTEEGERWVEVVAQARAKRLGRVLARMSRRDRLALARGLEAFLEQALDDAQTVPRLCGRCRLPHTPACVVDRVSRTLTGRGVAREPAPEGPSSAAKREERPSGE